MATDGMETKWLVCQSLGFSKTTHDIAPALDQKYKQEKAALLPRGGVAYKLQEVSVTRKRPRGAKAMTPISPKLFCFLPLPQFTGLPVHVNGHFVLDSESRNDIYNRDEDTTSFKYLWNKCLLSDVIASTYLQLVKEVKAMIPSNLLLRHSALWRELDRFKTVLPGQPLTKLRPQMAFLQKGLLLNMATSTEPLIPMIKRKHGHFETDSTKFPHSEIISIEWTRLQDGVYFDDLHQQLQASTTSNLMYALAGAPRVSDEPTPCDVMRNVLLNCGFPFTALPLYMIDRWKECNVKEVLNWSDVRSRLTVTPATIIEFLKRQSTSELLHVPGNIAQTPFITPRAVQVVFDYVKQARAFSQVFKGLPLLLTADNILHSFFVLDKPVFVSRHDRLLPRLPHMFLHHAYMDLPAALERLLPGVVKEMLIADFAQLLSDELDPDVYYNKDAARYPNKARVEWLCRCYDFLYEKCPATFGTSEPDATTVRDVLRPLDHWCLVPANVGTTRVLRPVQEAPYIFDSYISGLLLLQKLNLPRIFYPEETTSGRNMKEVLKQLTASVHNKIFVLRALHKHLKNEHSLVTEAAWAIVDFFNKNIQKISSAPGARKMLRELPIYVTATGQPVSLSQAAEVYLLPEDICTKGLNKLTSTDVVFLQQHDIFRPTNLYKFINCISTGIETFYVSYVLPQAKMLTLNDLQKHLLNLRPRPISNNFLSHLKQLRFMKKKDGHRYTASNFYDSDVELFKVMQSDDDFPSPPYNAVEWRAFLCSIGLITDVTPDMCAKYANDIANKRSNHNQCSELLVKHMNIHRQQQELFMAVKNISFLPRSKVAEDLSTLAADDTHCSMVSYESATSEKYAVVCWTVLPILPNWAIPLGDAGDVVMKPTAEHVQQHMTNLHAAHESKLSEEKSALIKSLQDVYVRCLEYVSELELQDYATSKLFTKIPAVITDQGKFVKASQLVVEQETGWHGLEPLICKLPIQFGAQADLLRRLGMTEKISLHQVVTSLNELHAASAGEQLMVNQAKKALMLCVKLFRLLERADDDEAPAAITELHLLTQQAIMGISSEVFIVDNENVAKQEFVHRLPIIADLNLEINESTIIIAPNVQLKVMKKLPELLRPKPLSEEVSEELDATCLQNVMSCDVAEKLQEKLAMREFHLCLLSLKKHSESSSVGSVEELTSEIEAALACFEFIGLARVQVRFKQNGKFIGQKKTHDFYAVHDLLFNKVKIYVRHKIRSKVGLLGEVSKLIINLPLFKECVGSDMQLHTKELLDCTAEEIMEVFNQFKIPLYGTPKTTQNTVPDPGDFVPQSYEHMLEMTFARLAVGDYIAYLIDDPFINNDGTGALESTYIYAKVLQVILPDDQADEMSPMLYKYEIDVGKEKKVVSSLDLYRFKEYKSRENDEAELGAETMDDVTSLQVFAGDTSSFTQQPSASGASAGTSASRSADTSGSAHSNDEDPQTLSEIKAYIKKRLIEAREQKFDETQRRKLQKRLYLKFHPDKNLHRIAIATEACKYLQKMIDRLENGERLDDDVGDDSYKARGSGRRSGRKRSSYFYQNFENNSYFRERFRRDKQHEQNFTGFNFGKKSRRRQRAGSSKTGTSPEGPSQANPQPGVARRWITQARHDLNAVNCDQLHSNFEWAAYKCHQAAEKATKAAQFKVDATYDKPQYATLAACECDHLVSKLRQEIGPADDMQYPSDTSWEAFCVPHKRYTEEMARNAVEITQKIVDNCERFISNA